MFRQLKNSKGGGVLLGVIVVSIVTLTTSLIFLRGITASKNLARRIANQNQFKLLIDPLATKVLIDLQLAARYPDALGLRNPPNSPAPEIPCSARGLAPNAKYTLDAYLVPDLISCKNPYPKTSPPYPYTTKTFDYPKGVVSTPSGATVFIPESNPSVRLTKIPGSPFLYTLNITFNMCNPPVAGRTQPSDIENTINKAWPTSCPASQLARMTYDAIINVDTPYFQDGSGLYSFAPDSSSLTEVSDALTAIYQAGDITEYNETITNLQVKGLQFTKTSTALTGLGLQLNDVLISINGQPVFEKTREQISGFLTLNTPIRLSVFRENAFITLSCGMPCI
ncbi:MAG: hypothetical protein HQ462_02335 [Deltaproteobacteria bacterium]|nr:hypothetical protein [Deltaproteobacteria bacterium]